jgi:hypothetical protein
VQKVAIPQITERLHELSADKLAVVYDFVSYLAEREKERLLRETFSDAYQTMLASEAVLGRDWERSEEDAAWATL